MAVKPRKTAISCIQERVGQSIALGFPGLGSRKG